MKIDDILESKKFKECVLLIQCCFPDKYEPRQGIKDHLRTEIEKLVEEKAKEALYFAAEQFLYGGAGASGDEAEAKKALVDQWEKEQEK